MPASVGGRRIPNAIQNSSFPTCGPDMLIMEVPARWLMETALLGPPLRAAWDQEGKQGQTFARIDAG